MKKPALQDRGTQAVGLATEHRLPEAFKAKTNSDADTVEIKKLHHKPINVAVNSFASIANLLAMFSPEGEPTLDPGHTIRIADDFSGKSVTVTANAILDVAVALQAFAVHRGKYKPPIVTDQPPVEEKPVAKAAAKPATKPAAAVKKTEEVAASEPVQETPAAPSPEVPAEVAQPASAEKAPRKKGGKAAREAAPSQTATEPAPKPTPEPTPEPSPEPAPAPAAVTSAPAKAAPPAKAKAKGKAKPKGAKGKGKAAPAAPSGDPAVMPAWLKAMPTQYVDEDKEFTLEQKPLSLTKPRGKIVTGVNDGGAENPAFGYEVVANGKHVGWVIAEAEDSYIVTGFGNIEPSKHRVLSSAMIRIKVSNLPSISA